MLTVVEFNLGSSPEYKNSLQEVLKQEMIRQEIIFRKQVYELHRLYQIQKNLTGDSGCKELDAFKFWKERLQSPVSPYTNLIHCAAPAEGKLSTNLAVGSTESLNHHLSSDCKLSFRDEVDLTLRIGENGRKKGRVKEAYDGSRFFPHCVIDLETSSDTVSQEDTQIASALTYATPANESKQDLPFYVQANQVSPYCAKTDISRATVSDYTVYGRKSCEEENSFNLGCKELNSGISSNETLLRSSESIGFNFDLNKVQLDDSCDLNDPADSCLSTPGPYNPFDKLKGIYSDVATSHAISREKVKSDILNEPTIIPQTNVSKENLTDICDVEKSETREENSILLQLCKDNTWLEDLSSSLICSTTRSVGQMNEESVEVDALIQEAAELLFQFSLGSSVSNRAYSTNAGSDLIEDEGNDRPQCSLDSYESLILKLEETSVDDYCATSKPFEVDEFDTKERGVMWRRGRRLKDFQKDILPNLVSLSRHEIREDVGVMEAAMRSREYKRMRSQPANRQNWFTTTKCKRSRPR